MKLFSHYVVFFLKTYLYIISSYGKITFGYNVHNCILHDNSFRFFSGTNNIRDTKIIIFMTVLRHMVCSKTMREGRGRKNGMPDHIKII